MKLKTGKHSTAQKRILFIGEGLDLPESHLLRGLKDAGHHVELMVRPDSVNGEALKKEGFHVHPLTLVHKVDFAGIGAIRSRLTEGRFDVMHTLLNRPLSNGLLASMGMGVKRVAYRGIVGNLSHFNPGSWLTYLNPSIDRIVCVCHAVRKGLLAMGLPQDRPVTIYKGHDVTWYHPVHRASLSEFGIPGDAFVIGSSANMRPRKGIHVLIQAAERVSAHRPVHFLLVGRIQDKLLSRLSMPAQLAERVHFTGFRFDAPALMGACDAFVLPSLKREGLARSLMEAMSQSVVPVVTDCGGSPELVRHEQDGLVVPPGDAHALSQALTLLLNDPGLRARMGASARTRIEKDFSIQQTVAEHIRLYESLP